MSCSLDDPGNVKKGISVMDSFGSFLFFSAVDTLPILWSLMRPLSFARCGVNFTNCSRLVDKSSAHEEMYHLCTNKQTLSK